MYCSKPSLSCDAGDPSACCPVITLLLPPYIPSAVSDDAPKLRWSGKTMFKGGPESADDIEDRAVSGDGKVPPCSFSRLTSGAIPDSDLTTPFDGSILDFPSG